MCFFFEEQEPLGVPHVTHRGSRNFYLFRLKTADQIRYSSNGSAKNDPIPTKADQETTTGKPFPLALFRPQRHKAPAILTSQSLVKRYISSRLHLASFRETVFPYLYYAHAFSNLNSRDACKSGCRRERFFCWKCADYLYLLIS